MKKGIIFGAVIIVIIISLLTISISRIEEVPILNVKAEVTVSDDNQAVTVKIVNVEQDAVNPLKAPRGDSNVGFPSVDAKAIINNAKVSYWASNPYWENGTYNFVIGFPRGVTPEQGDMVKVIVNVVDARGRTLASDTRIIIWE